MCFPASQCRTCHLTLSDMRSASGLAVGVRGSGCVRGTRRSVVASCLLPTWRTLVPPPRGSVPVLPLLVSRRLSEGGWSQPASSWAVLGHAHHTHAAVSSSALLLGDLGPAQLHRVKLRCETGTEEARPPAWPAGLPEPPPPRPRGLHVPLHWKSPSVPVRKT